MYVIRVLIGLPPRTADCDIKVSSYAPFTKNLILKPFGEPNSPVIELTTATGKTTSVVKLTLIN